MLRTRNDQPTLWDAIIPPELLELPEQLARVDRLLDDERFFAPFVPHFHATEGRPSIRMETYLRLVPQVSLRVGLRAAGGRSRGLVDLAAVLPDPARRTSAASDHADEDHHPLRRRGGRTAQRCAVGAGGRGQAGADAQGPYRHHRDRGRRGVSDRLGAVGQGPHPDQCERQEGQGRWRARRTSTRDRSRSAGKRARSIAANLKRRTGEAKDEVRRITADLAELAGTAAVEAEREISTAKRALRRQGAAATGKLARAVADLETLLERTGKIIVQTRTRLAGDTPPGRPGWSPSTIPTRDRSSKDGSARPATST